MRVVVVGAGLSGLMAARTLQADGHDVVVLDKGRSVGGRLATRRIDTPDGRTARVDHGAQFFTVRTPTLQTMVEEWTANGLVREWSRGFTRGSLDRAAVSVADHASADVGDGFARYVVAGGMTALAKHLAVGLDVRVDHLVTHITPAAVNGWSIALDAHDTIEADAVIVTSPLPQTCALLAHSGVVLPEPLRTTAYDATIALLAVLDAPSAVPAPGGVQFADDVFSWIGDNVAKGVSDVPALTFHASPEWSDAHWNDGTDRQHELLVEAAAPWLGRASIVASQVKTWRYATPRTVWPEPCWQAATAEPLVLAGDAFAGPRVEGAVLSGLAAATAVLAPG